MRARDYVANASPRQQLPDDNSINVTVELLRLLADPTRLRLLWLLADTEYDVTTLTQLSGAPPPAVSQHLARLRLGGVVATRREGRRILYRQRTGHLRAVITQALEQADHQLRNLPDQGVSH